MSEGMRLIDGESIIFDVVSGPSFGRLPVTRRPRRKTTKKRVSRIKRVGKRIKRRFKSIIRRGPRRKRKTSRRTHASSHTGKARKKRTGSIHFTKKGQPFKIMANGRARFIKKTR